MLYFTNPGVIDIRGATIAGLSAKDTDKPIGLFGTGLKYSIACILRWGGEFTIRAGSETYTFHTDKIKFRGNEFAQVMISNNGDTTPLGFTTEYGKQWEPWMVFRELLANARDEGGDVTIKDIPHSNDKTSIVVSCPELEEMYKDRDTIILPSNKAWTLDTPDCQISFATSPYIYYRNVRMETVVDSALTYNILHEQKLTEDRTLMSKYGYYRTCAETIQKCNDEKIIRAALISSSVQESFEANFFFASYVQTSPEFIQVAKSLYKLDAKTYEFLKDIIAKHAPELTEPTELTLSPLRQKMLDRAIQLSTRMGQRPAEVPIIAADLGPTVLGRYDPTLDKIYIDPKVFDQGTKQVLSTLYEELLHRETKLQDNTYEMQTHLFNTIVSLYEEHVFQEPV